MPKFLLKHLVDYVIFRQNSFPTGMNKIAPRVALTGNKLRFKQELSVGFGDYDEAVKPSNKSNCSSVMEPRTEPAIALSPCGNIRGSWNFLNVNTGHIIRRSIWKRMAMSELVVKRIIELTKVPLTIDMDVHEDDDDTLDDNIIEVEPYPDPVYIEEVHNVTPVESKMDDVNVPTTMDVEMEQQVESDIKQNIVEHDGSDNQYHVNMTVRQARIKNIFNVDAAIENELKSIISKEVFSPIKRTDMPKVVKVIPSHVIMKEKYSPDGKFLKLKARLVAGGHMQDPSNIYVDSTYSPTPKIHHIFSVMSRLLGDEYEMETADFETAYLNAQLMGISTC